MVSAMPTSLEEVSSSTHTKRKRGKETSKNPTTSSAKKQAVSLPAASSQLEDTNLLSVLDPSLHPQPENTSSHAYQTRPSNNLHPGKHVGVEKRHQSEISAKAAAKRADRQGKLDAKLQKQEEKANLEKEGVAVVAALMDKYGGGESVSDADVGDSNELALVRGEPKPKTAVSCSAYGSQYPYLSTYPLLFPGTHHCQREARPTHVPALGRH